MSQCACEIKGRRYILDLEPVEFEIWPEKNTRGRPCLCFVWRRKTQFRNIIQLRLLTFHLGPPWVTHALAITDLDEPVEEEER